MRLQISTFFIFHVLKILILCESNVILRNKLTSGAHKAHNSTELFQHRNIFLTLPPWVPVLIRQLHSIFSDILRIIWKSPDLPYFNPWWTDWVWFWVQRIFPQWTPQIWWLDLTARGRCNNLDSLLPIALHSKSQLRKYWHFLHWRQSHLPGIQICCLEYTCHGKRRWVLGVRWSFRGIQSAV